jgi:transcriptional regulator with XRE-family HTH domain
MVYIVAMRPDELKRWRQRIGCSQAQLARVLSVDVMTISRWERGVREIPSFLHLALGYLELKGVEIKERKQKIKRKGGK